MIDLYWAHAPSYTHLDTFLRNFDRVMKKMRPLFLLQFSLLDMIIIELPEDILPS